MILRVLKHSLLVLGIATLGLWVSLVPLEYLRLDFGLVWTFLGVFLGGTLGSIVLRSKRKPIYLMSYNDIVDLNIDQEMKNQMLFAWIILSPPTMVWGAAIVAGIVQLQASMLPNWRLPVELGIPFIWYMVANFSTGMILSIPGAVITLLTPLVLYSALRK